MLKYVIYPGEVVSESDGEKHFIGAEQLARLYGVDLTECMVVDDRRKFTPASMMSWRKDSGLIHLYTRSDGDYKLPAINKRGYVLSNKKD